MASKMKFLRKHWATIFFCSMVAMSMFTQGCASDPAVPPKSVLDKAVGVGDKYNQLDQTVQSLLPPGATNVNYLGNGYYEFQWTPPHNIQSWYVAVMSNSSSSIYAVVSITKE